MLVALPATDGQHSMARQTAPGKPFVKGDPRCGRPKGSRNKLGEDFFRALSEDFEENGIDAIKAARAADPVAYVNVVAKLMPKELKVERKLGELSDSELDNLIATLRDALATAGDAIGAGSREDEAQIRAALN
jgi:hypothetical protein